MKCLNKGKSVLTPWCMENEAEEKVKEKSALESKLSEAENENNLTGAAKTLCIPLQ